MKPTPQTKTPNPDRNDEQNYSQILDQPLSPGTDLWIIADLESSAWSKKLDWYLNFQLRRASLHKSMKISDSFRDKILSWGIKLPEMPPEIIDTSSVAPTMIASRKLLPNELTVQIPMTDIKTWASECRRISKQLKLTKARVFLPRNVKAQEFLDACEGLKANLSFEIVEDSALEASGAHV